MPHPHQTTSRGGGNVLKTAQANEMAQQEFLTAVNTQINSHPKVYDPGYASQQDANIWDKMRQDPNLAGSFDFYQLQVAGDEYKHKPGREKDPNSVLLAKICDHGIIDEIELLEASLYEAAEARFRGSSWLYIHGEHKHLDLVGDGDMMKWWVPTRLEPLDKWSFRKVHDVEKENQTKKKHLLWQFRELGTHSQWCNIDHPEFFMRVVFGNAERSLGFGRGANDSLFMFYRYVQVAIKLWLQGAEKHAWGWVIAKISSSSFLRKGNKTSTQATNMLAIIAKMKSLKTMVIDKDDEIDIKDASGQGHQIFKELVEMLYQSMRRYILGALGPTGAQGDGGSYAQSKVEENSQTSLIKFGRKIIQSPFSRDVTGLFLNMNRGNIATLGLQKARRPRFVIKSEVIKDPLTAAQVVQTLLSSSPNIQLDAEEISDATEFTVTSGEADGLIKGAPAPAGGGFGVPGAA